MREIRSLSPLPRGTSSLEPLGYYREDQKGVKALILNFEAMESELIHSTRHIVSTEEILLTNNSI